MAVKTAEKVMSDVHHMVRTLGNQPHTDGTVTVDQADADVRTWLDAGYDLFNTHYIGETPNGVRILYIFVKRDPA